MTTTTITGRTAITVAEMLDIRLRKHADPTAPAADIDADEARDICREDPSLVYVDATEVAEAIDDHRIKALRREAFDADDDAQAALCDRALEADDEWHVTDRRVSDRDAQRIERMTQVQARVECARVIAEARAQARS